MSRLIELLFTWRSSIDIIALVDPLMELYYQSTHKPIYRARSGLERTCAEIGVNEEIDITHGK